MRKSSTTYALRITHYALRITHDRLLLSPAEEADGGRAADSQAGRLCDAHRAAGDAADSPAGRGMCARPGARRAAGADRAADGLDGAALRRRGAGVCAGAVDLAAPAAAGSGRRLLLLRAAQPARAVVDAARALAAG